MAIFRLQTADGEDAGVYVTEDDIEVGDAITTHEREFVVVRRVQLPLGEKFDAALEVAEAPGPDRRRRRLGRRCLPCAGW
jgi:hypothetical protein